MAGPQPEDQEERRYREHPEARRDIGREFFRQPPHDRRHHEEQGEEAEEDDRRGDRRAALVDIAHTAASLACSARISSSRRRWLPSSPKFSGASQASKACFRSGHSPSIIENQAVSRLVPFEIMCWRKTPSKLKP